MLSWKARFARMVLTPTENSKVMSYHRKVQNLRQGGEPLLPRVHLVISLLKRWLLGTLQGSASAKYLDDYLNDDGCLNGMAVQPTHSGFLDLVGAVAALFVAVAIVAAYVIWLKRPWMRVAVRVVGSWITATGLLLLGWSVHSGRL